MATTWIRKNMLQSPCPEYNIQTERKMTENELRVLRSIQKLSIPDWYLNSNSKPPKILSNDTPIEQRPPSWKNMPTKKSTNLENTKNTVCKNGVLETPIDANSNGNRNYGTYKINRDSKSSKSPKKNSPSKTQNGENTKLKNIEKTSQTFPRISPSRKIPNINIVLPQPSKRLMVTDLDEDITIISDMSKDSLEKTDFEDQKTEKELPEENQTKKEDKDPQQNFSDSNKENHDPAEILLVPIKNLLSRPPSCDKLQAGKAEKKSTKKNVPKKNSNEKCCNCSCKTGSSGAKTAPQIGPRPGFRPKNILPPILEGAGEPTPSCPFTIAKDSPITSPNSTKQLLDNFIKREQQNDQSRSTTNACNISSVILEKNANANVRQQNQRRRTSVMIDSKIFIPQNSLEFESIVKQEHEQQSCSQNGVQSVNARFPPNSEKSSELEHFVKQEQQNARTVLANEISLENCIQSTPQKSFMNDSQISSPLNTTKKSSELEGIVKRAQQDRPRKSLVSEIIQELNEKCRFSSEQKYFSPSSRNFVKNLVRALESGEPLPKQEEDIYQNNEAKESEEDLVSSENTDEIKSAAMSTSISYSGSGSDSGSALEEPDYDAYDWNMNVRVDEVGGYVASNNNYESGSQNVDQTSTLPGKEEKEVDDGEWIYWNQESNWNMPRTSSLLSVTSGTSTNCDRVSPCISPIDEPTWPRRSNSRNQGFFDNGWGTIYRTRQGCSSRFYLMNETAVLDSGYSDRSSNPSSLSFYYDDQWYEYTEPGNENLTYRV